MNFKNTSILMKIQKEEFVNNKYLIKKQEITINFVNISVFTCRFMFAFGCSFSQQIWQ